MSDEFKTGRNLVQMQKGENQTWAENNPVNGKALTLLLDQKNTIN